MTDLPLTPKKANGKLRLDESKKAKNLSENEREYLFDRYSLDELVRHFGRWPTYYLLLRHMGSRKPGKFVLGVGVVGVIASLAVAYLRH
jgi:hypothetical protein